MNKSIMCVHNQCYALFKSTNLYTIYIYICIYDDDVDNVYADNDDDDDDKDDDANGDYNVNNCYQCMN